MLVGGCRRPAQPEGGPPKPAPPAPVVTDTVAEALAEFNKGAALLEKRKYGDAVEAFERVLEFAPDWLAARFNLGLAHYNMEKPEHVEASRRIYEEVIEADPEHLHARFCLGLYYQHVGKNDKALECLERVYQADSSDLHVCYKYAETLLALGRQEEGIKVLEEVVEQDPGLNSAVYRLGQQYMRMRRPEKGREILKRFEALRSDELTEGAFTVREAYGYAGKYYLALGADNLPLPPPERTPTPRVVFSPETKPLPGRTSSWQWKGGQVSLPGIAVGDVDGDGDQDLCLTGVDEQGSASVWRNDGSGKFSPGPPLIDKAVSPFFGDVDNDGDLDLWLGRAGPDVLLQNDGEGNFYWSLPIGLLGNLQGLLESADGSGSEPSSRTGLAGADRLTCSARLLDLDSDGDLDFVAFRLAGGSVPEAGDAAPAPSSVWNNDRDGTFTDIAERLGLTLADTPVAAAVYDDLDNDRDIDLVIFPAGDSEPIGWVNYRVWKYEKRDAAATGLQTRGVIGATSGDPDKDGDRDLLLFTGERVELYVNQGEFRFQRDEAFSDRCGQLGGTGGQFADVDNDGDVDLVIADARRPDGTRGPALLLNAWPEDGFLSEHDLDPGNLFSAISTEGDASCVVGDFTGNGRCDVLLAPAGDQPVLIENVTPGGHWIAIDLAGTRKRDKTTRSNHSAIGARVEVKSGRVFQQFVVGVPSGPVATPPLRIHAGLGDNPKVEWLRVIWPDGVLQGEVEVPADQVMTLTEIQRKETSCPHLFAWNGTRFELVADFGGVGGLGYFLAPGAYATPDPTEYLLIPHIEPLDGQYVLQATEPLEEIVYFDEAKLIAVDHPAGTEVYPNEMAAVGVPPPAFEVFCYRKPIDPVRAVDHRGVEVTDQLLRIDRRYAGATEPDYRFAGFAREHSVELDFGDRLKDVSADSRLVLFLYGWVKYGDSTANYAAGQAGLRLEAPSVHVLREGRWVELFHEVGYPAGLQHMMTLEVTGEILPTDQRIRISSNMELYWDRIFLAEHLDDASLALKEVPAKSAELQFFGYPREYSPDGQGPNLYDYGNVDPGLFWKLMEGDYTRYGEVAELLLEPDDCYVIMKHGEQLTLRFPAEAFGPVPEGRRRSFLLKTDSFCKDMDLYTAYSSTVEPLPFHGMSGYPYGPDEQYPDTEKTRDYRRRFNTRRVRSR